MIYTRFLIISTALFLFVSYSSASDSTATSSRASRLVILQPVNLENGKVDTSLGTAFRNIFSGKKMWEVISLQEMEKKFGEYSKDVNTPCKDLSCALDAGNILQAKYTMFSTVTLFQEYYIFSFNLMDISVTTVIWSEIGEVLIKKGENPTEALVHRLSQLTEGLDSDKLKRRKVLSKGTLGILNLSEPSDYSKILHNRLTTQVYLSGLYDLVGEKELGFLLESFDIKPSKIEPVRDSLLSLGENLGVDYLIYSLLKRKGEEFILQLALYDIKKKMLLREWPYESSNFRKLLKFEDKFFSSLNVTDEPAPEKKQRSRDFNWKWVTVPASVIVGGVFGYLAWSENRSGDDMYSDWQNARTLEEISGRPALEQEINDSRVKRNILGGMGAFCIAGSAVLFTF